MQVSMTRENENVFSPSPFLYALCKRKRRFNHQSSRRIVTVRKKEKKENTAT